MIKLEASADFGESVLSSPGVYVLAFVPGDDVQDSDPQFAILSSAGKQEGHFAHGSAAVYLEPGASLFYKGPAGYLAGARFPDKLSETKKAEQAKEPE